MNSSFVKRLGWYLVGFSLGLIALAFIINKKSGGKGVQFCYLPNCRVLKDFRSKPLLTADKDSVFFSDLDTFTQRLLLEGQINFAASNSTTKPCKTYLVSYLDKNYQLRNCGNYWEYADEYP